MKVDMDKILEFFSRLCIGRQGFYDIDKVNFMLSSMFEHYKLRSVKREENKIEANSNYTKIEIRKSNEATYEFNVKFDDGRVDGVNSELVGEILLNDSYGLKDIEFSVWTWG